MMATEPELTGYTTIPQYVSLNNVNDHMNPPHLGKQRSYQSIASELTNFTRLSSQIQYDQVASVISAYSSFIPSKKLDLIQIEYEVTEKSKKLSSRILYVSSIVLFLIFYILLFFHETSKVAEYGVLIMSLQLSLLYTVLPSCIKPKIPCFCTAADDAEQYANKKKQETLIVTVRKLRIPLDQSTVPVICVLLLLFSTKFTWNDAFDAMLGNNSKIKPWAVLGILFALCYLCITLDLTGILQAMAKKCASAAEPSQKKLFLFIFLFAAILTIVTNNDISIICLTPLVISTANSGGIDAQPFIFMVLFASNTFSMLLITGNPANLIVSQQAELEYVPYLKYMIVPTLITGMVLYGELYFMFNTNFQTTYNVKKEHNGSNTDWKDDIKLPRYSVFCAIRLFIACLLIPFVVFLPEKLQKLPLDMFAVMGVAMFSLIIDLMAFDIRRLAQFSTEELDTQVSLLNSYAAHISSQNYQNRMMLPAIDETADDDDIPCIELSGVPQNMQTSTSPHSYDGGSLIIDRLHSTIHSMQTNQTRQTHDTFNTYDPNHLLYAKYKSKIITFALDALWEIPWKLIPFVFSLFILVKFMEKNGFVKFLSTSLENLSNGNEWSAMFIVGLIGTILCQCINNQPMTVLMANVLSNTTWACDPDRPDGPDDDPNCRGIVGNERLLRGAYFALAIGANLGGNGTPIASLAVLMWKGILEKWGLYVDYIGFSKRGMCVTPLLVIVCILIVAIENMYIF